jgi:tetratricopeptide (TPR) repeat protein
VMGNSYNGFTSTGSRRSSRVRRRGRTISTVGAVVTWFTVSAYAEPRDQAAQHYDRGLELARGGAYSAAIIEFRRAYELSPHPAVLFNLGQMYVAVGDPVRALEQFERYLDAGGNSIPEARRAEVGGEIRRQKALTAALSIRTDPSGARITIDGVESGIAPLPAPVRVAAGTHQVAATLPGYRATERSLNAPAGSALELELQLEQLVEPVAARGRRMLAAPEARPPSSPATDVEWRMAGFVTAGIGVATLGFAVGHFVWNGNRYDTWRDTDRKLQSDRAASDYPERQLENDELAHSIERAQTVSVSLAVVGGVLISGGTVLVLTHPKRASHRVRPLQGWSLTPHALIWNGSW